MCIFCDGVMDWIVFAISVAMAIRMNVTILTDGFKYKYFFKAKERDVILFC